MAPPRPRLPAALPLGRAPLGTIPSTPRPRAAAGKLCNFTPLHRAGLLLPASASPLGPRVGRSLMGITRWGKGRFPGLKVKAPVPSPAVSRVASATGSLSSPAAASINQGPSSQCVTRTRTHRTLRVAAGACAGHPGHPHRTPRRADITPVYRGGKGGPVNEDAGPGSHG